MRLRKVTLENFRNYLKSSFSFGPGLTLILGPNTSGKTNLLEALYLLSRGQSHRAEFDREMIKEGEDYGLVMGEIEGSEEKELEVQLVAEPNPPSPHSAPTSPRLRGAPRGYGGAGLTRKKFKVGGIGKRWMDYTPNFRVVSFSPEDLNMVMGAPDLRRRFMDSLLSYVSPEYHRTLVNYEKVRKSRNRLLEQIHQEAANLDHLAFWDAKLLEFGALLQDRRKSFFEEINGIIGGQTPSGPIHDRPLHLQLQYLASSLTAERLHEYRPKEIAAEMTLIGPHRDDFSFMSMHSALRTNHSRDLSIYGSRGEQRKAVFNLKLAEVSFIQSKTGVKPLLLLDDIFSELDEENRAQVFDLLENIDQAILTTTDLHHIPGEIQDRLHTIRLG